MLITKEKGSWLQDLHKQTYKGNKLSKVHQDEIANFQKLNAVDKETARTMYFGRGPNKGRAIYDMPLHEAHVLNHLYPEIFLDQTGKSMMKFLKTSLGRRYAL